MLQESLQQIRVPENHTPTTVLTHVGQTTAGIDREGGHWRDQLRFKQGGVLQRKLIVFGQQLKNITAS